MVELLQCFLKYPYLDDQDCSSLILKKFMMVFSTGYEPTLFYCSISVYMHRNAYRITVLYIVMVTKQGGGALVLNIQYHPHHS